MTTKKLIQPYNPFWPNQFQKIHQLIAHQLKGQILSIEHVGSTAVPNLAAKAIIDIDIVYENDIFFPAICEGLTQLGYYHNGNQGIPKREAFKRKKQSTSHPILDTIPHHLYACPQDSPELQRHLAFRNFLRQHEWARLEYAQLKRKIAAQTNQDKAAYSILKETEANAFIERILVLAGI